MSQTRAELNKGFFGEFGGSFVPPELQEVLQKLDEAFQRYKDDPDFNQELDQVLKEYVGRPSPLYFAERLSRELGGARIYLKREDLNHTGAHKINNAVGQALLAKRIGATRVIAETGAGQHGVATATACAMLGLDCIIYRGERDTQRQSLNVFRMQLLGAKVVPVTRGTRTLKDAVDVALEDLVENVDNTFYLLGSAVGPHPFPSMVRHFQSIIGREGRLPDLITACVGGGSNAIGLFAPFVEDRDVQIVGAEPGGRSMNPGDHAASIAGGTPGVIHGFRCHMLQDEQGEIQPSHSIAAGLDYPGVGPEHSHLKTSGRADYVPVSDEEALEAFGRLSRTEGIIPALESAHAVAYAIRTAPQMNPDQILIVNLSGRGDKDVQQVFEMKSE